MKLIPITSDKHPGAIFLAMRLGKRDDLAFVCKIYADTFADCGVEPETFAVVFRNAAQANIDEELESRITQRGEPQADKAEVPDE